MLGELTKTTRQLTTAIDHGTPIFRVGEFLTWVEEHQRTQPATEEQSVPEPPTQEPPQPEPTPPPPRDTTPAQKPAASAKRDAAAFDPTSHAPRPAQLPPQPPDIKPTPFWVKLAARKFYGISIGIPLGLLLLFPLLLGIIAVGVPALSDALITVGAVSMLAGLLAVPVAVVLVALRLSGRRRHKQLVSLGDQRKPSL